ncbi:MAG: ATP synthase F1 subunit gamma [Mycoplasma sp.]|nr:ATP synthase F1 subunit gamma [Candidatus Hennigella equi]
MQSLDLIKKRIKSIEATKKITNAMKLVATTKIKSQLKSFEAVSVFCREYYRVFKALILREPNLDFLRLSSKQVEDKDLYILCTSDLGLCGPYNNNVCKHLIAQLRPQDKVLVFGQKGVSYLKMHRLGDHIIKTMRWDLDANNYYSLLPLSYEILADYAMGKYKNIKLVYTEFKSSVSYIPKTWNILPIWPELFGATKEVQVKDWTIFEPNAKDIIKAILPVYVSNLVYGALIESTLCESTSRRFAMEGATKNATELIDNLRIQYNQARQEAITQEINEIVAGATNKN